MMFGPCVDERDHLQRRPHQFAEAPWVTVSAEGVFPRFSEPKTRGGSTCDSATRIGGR
jgi:hypothetical protein